MTLTIPWLRHYRRKQLAGDFGAGVIVALMLIPQAMAYAIVAGLPPVSGLYASLLPVLAYALLGSSMVQSVGPMAITSLMTGTALAALAPAGSALYAGLALLLAFLTGVILLACGLLRLGFLANFLSRPVLSGFTSGAAIAITLGQLPMLLGLAATTPLTSALDKAHWPGVLLGLGSLLVLAAMRRWLACALHGIGLSDKAADIAGKLGPVAVLAAATLLCALGGELTAAIPVIGDIPAGLPGLTALPLLESLSYLPALSMPATLMAFMVFLSSQSAALTLAQKRNERIDSNRELLGLGAANIASAMTGGFPVTGSISRSAVNYTAGANTPLASVFTAGLLALLLVLPASWLQPLSRLPLPSLSAMIIIAVTGMIDTAILRAAWRYDRSDAMALLVTAFGVVLLGVERGIVLGIVLSFATLIGRTSRPHIAVIGQVAGSEHFRNIERHQVETLPHVLMIRVDAGLFFGNTQSVLERIESELGHCPATRHLVLVLSAVNMIDTSGLYLLSELNQQLKAKNCTLHLSEVKGPVMDRLKRHPDFLHELSGTIFLSTHEAFATLATDNPPVSG